MKKTTIILLISSLFILKNNAQNNHCLDLDGINDYVQINDFSLGPNFTISFWFKCGESSNINFEERMLTFGPDTRLEIGIDAGSNKLWLFDETTNFPRTAGGDLRDGEWHHVAFVRSSADRTTYLDGELVDSYQSFSTTIYGEFSRIGAWTGGSSPSTYFNGQIDETKIWSVAKTEAEIEETMSCPLDGDEPDLLAYWNFDQGTPGADNSGVTTLIDLSNNDKEGILVNLSLDNESSNWVQADNASVIYLDPNITVDGNNLVADASGVNYQWLDCNNNLNPVNGATNQIFMPSTSGLYAVEVSSGACITLSDCENITVTSLQNVQDAFECNIYPNPTAEVLFVETKYSTEISIAVSDIHGKIVLEKTSNEPLTDLDLSGLVAGTYFVQIVENGGKVIRKFMKK